MREVGFLQGPLDNDALLGVTGDGGKESLLAEEEEELLDRVLFFLARRCFLIRWSESNLENFWGTATKAKAACVVVVPHRGATKILVTFKRGK